MSIYASPISNHRLSPSTFAMSSHSESGIGGQQDSGQPFGVLKTPGAHCPPSAVHNVSGTDFLALQPPSIPSRPTNTYKHKDFDFSDNVKNKTYVGDFAEMAFYYFTQLNKLKIMFLRKIIPRWARALLKSSEISDLRRTNPTWWPTCTTTSTLRQLSKLGKRTLLLD